MWMLKDYEMAQEREVYAAREVERMAKKPETKAEKPAKAESYVYNWRSRKNLKRGSKAC